MEATPVSFFQREWFETRFRGSRVRTRSCYGKRLRTHSLFLDNCSFVILPCSCTSFCAVRFVAFIIIIARWVSERILPLPQSSLSV
ncbi:hypothetical protein V1506DRAFT_98514 [Lipomyces tetrasporus]